MNAQEVENGATGPRLECPVCGQATSIRREPDPEDGDLFVTELETMARNEWRARLGRSTY